MESIPKPKSRVTLTRLKAVEAHRLAATSLLVRQSLLLGTLAAANALLALIAVWFVVGTVGVSQDTDAFFASGALPQFVFLVLTAALLPVLVPLLATKDGKDFNQDLWSFFSLTLALFAISGFALYVFSSVWVPRFVPGFSAEGKALTVSLIKIQIISMLLNAAIVTLWAGHYARKRFVWVESTSIVANLAGLIFLALTLPRLGIMAAAWNTVFFNSLKLIFLLPILRGWMQPKWNSHTVAEAGRRLKLLLPSIVYLRTDALLDRLLASMSGAGALSVFFVSQQIYASANLLIGKSVAGPMVPNLALNAYDGSWHLYRRGYYKRLILVGSITFLGLLAIIVARPVLGMLAERAGVTSHKVLWLTMLGLAGVFVGGALGQVTAGAYYAAGNTKTPSTISTLIYTFCIPLKIAAFFAYGIIGLAAATSVFFLMNFAVQFFVLRKATWSTGADEITSSTHSHRTPAGDKLNDQHD